MLNKYEKEIELALINNEKNVLKELEKQHIEALTNIKQKIINLKAREQTQSVIYQLKFQKSLEKQINSIIEELKTKNIDTIDEYLNLMYQDGYIGLQYELNKQDIPITIPINQKQAIESVKKPIDGMIFSQRIDINMNDFKYTIKQEITKGLVSGLTYEQMAINISRKTQESLNKSYRIARTEGGRVVEEAKYKGMQEAEELGVKLTREWSSTLDDKTRVSHQSLDGQQRSINEKFRSPESGYETLYPRGFGIASEDVNCRCTVITRNSSFDDITRTRIAKIDGVNQLSEVKNYKEYKEKYSEIADKTNREIRNIINEIKK